MTSFDWQGIFLENALSFVIGTLLLGSAVELVRRGIDYLLTRRYRGWRLVVRPASSGREPYEHDLLWEEVRRFEQSAFECRKFVQSVCTSENFRLKEGQIRTDDSEGWVYIDRANKRYRIDFTRFPVEATR